MEKEKLNMGLLQEVKELLAKKITENEKLKEQNKILIQQNKVLNDERIAAINKLTWERCEDCQEPIDPSEVCTNKYGGVVCPGCAD